MTSIAQYDRARRALADASSVHEILPLIDEVENVRRYAKQINDRELLSDAEVFQMRIERKLGFVLTEAKKAGHFKVGRRKVAGDDDQNNGSGYTEPFPPATLEEAGVGKKLSMRAQKRSGIAEQAFELMVRATRERIAAANAVPVNGARAMAPGRKEPSASLDFSPTPPWATRALMERVFPAMSISRSELTSAHEPAAGEGHLAEVLREYFARVTCSDIFDYGTGDQIGDFLDDGFAVDADWIITNPPFKDMAEQFTLKALRQAKVGVAIFARLQWLETVGRYERIFRDQPPTQIAFFAERVNLCMGRWEPDGGTATAYIWLVWKKGEAPRAPFWIPPGAQESLTRPDDIERFTAHPVIRREHLPPHDPETGEVIEEIDGGALSQAENDLAGYRAGGLVLPNTVRSTSEPPAFPPTEFADLRKFEHDQMDDALAARIPEYEKRGLVSNALGPWRLTGPGKVRLAIVGRERNERIALCKARLDQQPFWDWSDLSSIAGGEHVDDQSVRSLVGADLVVCTEDGGVALTDAGRARLAELESVVDVDPRGQVLRPGKPIDLPLFLPADEAAQ